MGSDDNGSDDNGLKKKMGRYKRAVRRVLWVPGPEG